MPAFTPIPIAGPIAPWRSATTAIQLRVASLLASFAPTEPRSGRPCIPAAGR